MFPAVGFSLVLVEVALQDDVALGAAEALWVVDVAQGKDLST